MEPEAKEFDTNVSSAEERKRIRAQRIAARQHDSDAAANEADQAKKAAEHSRGKQQIAESLSHLDKKKSKGIESVTDVRVAADWREAQRRVAEEKKRQDRLQRLQHQCIGTMPQARSREAAFRPMPAACWKKGNPQKKALAGWNYKSKLCQAVSASGGLSGLCHCASSCARLCHVVCRALASCARLRQALQQKPATATSTSNSTNNSMYSLGIKTELCLWAPVASPCMASSRWLPPMSLLPETLQAALQAVCDQEAESCWPNQADRKSVV